MYKLYNIEKNDGFSILLYFGCNLDWFIFYYRYSCRKFLCLYMFYEYKGYWNSGLCLEYLNNFC